jgi:arabinose-5-phosphate isomerase
VDVVLDASVRREVDPNNLAPDPPAPSWRSRWAMRWRWHSSTPEPQRGGLSGTTRRALGNNLRLKVSDAMHVGGDVAWVGPDDPLKEVVVAMTCARWERLRGGRRWSLPGAITDGDLRRALRTHDDIRPLRARDVMTANPVSISQDARLVDALERMENRPSQISVLPVVDPEAGRCLGLVRLHDLYRADTG